MKEVGITLLACVIVFAVLVGGATWLDNKLQITEGAKAEDSTYTEPPRHDIRLRKAFSGLYDYHNPQCEFCQQIRHQEVEHIVDSMLKARGIQ